MQFSSFNDLARAFIFPGERRNFSIHTQSTPEGVSGAYKAAREGAFAYVAYPSRRKQVPQAQPHSVAYACAFWGMSYKH